MGKFTLRLARNIGGNLYEASTEVTIDPMDDPSEKLKAIDEANKQLFFLIERYAATVVPAQRNQQTVQGQLVSGQPSTAAITETVPAVWLNVSIHKGKRHYKITTARVNQYGIPIYEETLKQAGYEPEEIPLEGIDLKGYNIVCQKTGGKLTKVLRLDMEF